jgi:hypothetical protein
VQAQRREFLRHSRWGNGIELTAGIVDPHCASALLFTTTTLASVAELESDVKASLSRLLPQGPSWQPVDSQQGGIQQTRSNVLFPLRASTKKTKMKYSGFWRRKCRGNAKSLPFAHTHLQKLTILHPIPRSFVNLSTVFESEIVVGVEDARSAHNATCSHSVVVSGDSEVPQPRTGTAASSGDHTHRGTQQIAATLFDRESQQRITAENVLRELAEHVFFHLRKPLWG